MDTCVYVTSLLRRFSLTKNTKVLDSRRNLYQLITQNSLLYIRIPILGLKTWKYQIFLSFIESILYYFSFDFITFLSSIFNFPCTITQGICIKCCYMCIIYLVYASLLNKVYVFNVILPTKQTQNKTKCLCLSVSYNRYFTAIILFKLHNIS